MLSKSFIQSSRHATRGQVCDLQMVRRAYLETGFHQLDKVRLKGQFATFQHSFKMFQEISFILEHFEVQKGSVQREVRELWFHRVAHHVVKRRGLVGLGIS